MVKVFIHILGEFYVVGCSRASFKLFAPCLIPKDDATGSKSLEELRPSRGEYASSSTVRRSFSEVSQSDVHQNSFDHFELLERDLFASKENQVRLGTSLSL